MTIIDSIKVAVVAYCLSRGGSEALTSLGYKTSKALYEVIARKFNCADSSVKNYRDQYDPYLNNHRVGWNERAIRGIPRKVFHYYKNKSDAEVLNDAKEIIQGKEPAAVSLINSMNSKTLPVPALVIKNNQKKSPVVPFMPWNLIVYGAPGTGKSFYVNEKYGEKSELTRVVFHSRYSHADFVGTYKPVPLYENGKGNLSYADGSLFTLGTPHIDYQFVPGPFVSVLIKALTDPENNYTLVIEELNRAKAADVFGQVFQLLDRDASGVSEYDLTPSEELKRYLVLNGIQQDNAEHLRIPRNMFIVATMNSADQGVNVIDSAFKRRWDFKYLRINVEEAEHRNAIFQYAGKDITWGAFVTALNKKLRDEHIGEDKLIGPYYVSPNKVNSSYIANKLLPYLWEDVLRLKRYQGFFYQDAKQLSDLLDDFEEKDVLGINSIVSQN